MEFVLVGVLLICSDCCGGFFGLQVVIEGFKSYKEQIATEPFSPQVNCVGDGLLLVSCFVSSFLVANFVLFWLGMDFFLSFSLSFFFEN